MLFSFYAQALHFSYLKLDILACPARFERATYALEAVKMI